MIDEIKQITDKISMDCLGTFFGIRIEHDNEFENGRIFIQVFYCATCSKTGKVELWHGRKWYLSKHMTDDEIVKTCFAAFKAAVEHEVMEGFKFDGTALFNPHVDFMSLLSVSNNEIKREIKK